MILQLESNDPVLLIRYDEILNTQESRVDNHGTIVRMTFLSNRTPQPLLLDCQERVMLLDELTSGYRFI